MQSIRLKIKLVIVLLVAAAGVATKIYERGGFELGYKSMVKPVYPSFERNYPWAASAVDGKTLFGEYCASCHSMETEIVGPPLKGVMDRVRSDTFVETLLLHPQQLIETNSYANALYVRYGKQVHISYAKTLTTQQIHDIIAYLY